MAGLFLSGALMACSPRPEAPPAPAASPPAPAEARPPRAPVPPERVPISETPCRQAIGEAASARLVQRCIAVSPATRPPCNAANPCDLIQGEIDRSCNQYGPGETRPKECAA
ncbi:MAG: hypothetical protein ACT6RD_05970 [Brevundimonas sp.]|uniref:hypothetical protein n=1 Tax=Brevundimonas sp. TaxID=1871086 RepID=UPI0040334255